MPRPSRILVVDDEPERRAMVGEYLVRHDYAVAEDGTAMERALLGGLPDLVLRDVIMPGRPEPIRTVRGAGSVFSPGQPRAPPRPTCPASPRVPRTIGCRRRAGASASARR